MKEFVLWAVAKGAEDWQEQLITSTTSREHLNKAKTWATANGFDRLRVSTLRPGEKPDFAKTVRV